jgi:hypothetical protein
VEATKELNGVGFRWLGFVLTLDEAIFVPVMRWGTLSLARIITTYGDASFLGELHCMHQSADPMNSCPV